MARIKIFGGESAIIGGVKTSVRLKVEVPQGMTGRQLAKWKARNESALLAMVDSGNFESLPAGDDSEGDRLTRE